MLPVVVKHHGLNSLKETKFILGHGFWGFSPWSTDLKMEEICVLRGRGKERETERKGPGTRHMYVDIYMYVTKVMPPQPTQTHTEECLIISYVSLHPIRVTVKVDHHIDYNLLASLHMNQMRSIIEAVSLGPSLSYLHSFWGFGYNFLSVAFVLSI